MLIRLSKGSKEFFRMAMRDRHYIIMFIPALIYFFIFHYLPMIGIVIAFKDYTVGSKFLTCQWVGLKWFIEFFESPSFFRVVRNTLLLNIYNIIFMFTFTIFFSIMLNEIRKNTYKKIAQTISYLPYFISTVIIVGLIINFLSTEAGIVNKFLNMFGIESINFMQDSRWFRTIYVGSNVWTYFGFNSIIYISSMSSINMEIYDAADVDGANRIQKIFKITLPSISQTIGILLILNLGHLFSSGFEKIILMYNPATYETADVIGSYIYRRGIQGSDFSFSTAVSLIGSTVNYLLIVIFNFLGRKTFDISLW